MSIQPAHLARSNRGVISILLLVAAVALAGVLWATKAQAASVTPGTPATSEVVDNSASTPGNPGAVETRNAVSSDIVLRHVDAAGNIISGRDVINDVRSSRHIICAFTDDGTDVDSVLDNGAEVSGFDDPHDQVNISFKDIAGWYVDPQIFDGQTVFPANSDAGSNNSNDEETSCLSWISEQAGDQSITWSVNGTQYGWNTLGNAGTNNALVKEWNVLQDSDLIVNGSNQGSNYETNVYLAPLPTGGFFANLPHVDDHFLGSHIMNNGQSSGELRLTGVVFEVEIDGCGSLDGNTDGTTSEGTPDPNFPSVDLFVEGSGHDLNTGIACGPGRTMTVTFIGSEGNIGSGEGNVVRERVILHFLILPAQKHTLLAWAGQRVVLEHDWRLPPGDGYDNFCPLTGSDMGGEGSDAIFPTPIVYVNKGGGSFIPALNGVSDDYADQITVFVDDGTDQDGDAPDNPQANCISRALYEDEGEGQDDIEAFIGDPHAFLSFQVCVGQLIAELTATLTGTWEGDISGTIDGTLDGTIDATVDGDISGTVTGTITGTFSGTWSQNETDSQTGTFTGTFDVDDVTLDGTFEGTITGTITGDVDGTIDGTFEGTASGTLQGEITGDIVGTIIQACAGVVVPIPAPNFNASKVSFVVYYMKLESVTTSLVSQVSKPTHNGSSPWGIGASVSDYSPGNPWNASNDDADANVDWNVSKDLLVRVRVKGWFENENPSGRAADTSDPFNIRPANRWVMPDDWALLAGPDPLVNRPQFDTMIAPGNGSISLADPLYGNVIIGTTHVCSSTWEGPFSTIDIPGPSGSGTGPDSCTDSGGTGLGAALSNVDDGDGFRDTILKDGAIDWWDAPMPPARVRVSDRGAGFLKPVAKEDVYYLGDANSTTQTFPNPFYYANIPDNPWMQSVDSGGGFNWDSWGTDGPPTENSSAHCEEGEFPYYCNGPEGQGPYHFWVDLLAAPGINVETGLPLEALTAAQVTELNAISDAYDVPVGRDLTVYSDNHGEVMVTANGDFNLTYDDCATNVLGGGKHCEPGDKVGTSTINATADYPDRRGKHFPVKSADAHVNWIWAGYKTISLEDDPAGSPQIKYLVFHALDRDGFCDVPAGSVSLHPVLSGETNDTFNGNPPETVDFLIDAGEGIIIDSALNGAINTDGTRTFATGVKTFSTAVNTTEAEFPFSDLAAAGATDECQAWVKVSNSLLSLTNFLVIAHDDEGDIGFDQIIDYQTTVSFQLTFRWTLHTWVGPNNIPVSDALKGTGLNDLGNDIYNQVTAVYGWQQASQEWLGFFPSGVSVPGANDLIVLQTGQAYWIAIVAPGPVTWTYATNVGP